MKRSISTVIAPYEDIEDAHKNSNNEHLADLAVQLREYLGGDMGTVWTLDAKRLGTSRGMASRGVKTYVSEWDADTYKSMAATIRRDDLKINLYKGCIADNLQRHFAQVPYSPRIGFLYLDFMGYKLDVFRRVLKLFSVNRTRHSILATTFSMRIKDNASFYTDEEIKKAEEKKKPRRGPKKKKRYWTFEEYMCMVQIWMGRLLPGADIQTERIVGYKRDSGDNGRKRARYSQSMAHCVFLIDWPVRVETEYMPLRFLRKNVPGDKCDPPKPGGLWDLVQWAGFPNDHTWEMAGTVVIE